MLMAIMIIGINMEQNILRMDVLINKTSHKKKINYILVGNTSHGGGEGIMSLCVGHLNLLDIYTEN